MDETEVAHKKTRICCRRPVSRMCHGLLAVLFLSMMLACFASLAIFAIKHNAITGELQGDGGKCILYTTKKQLEDGHLSKGVSCRFAIWGSAVVATGCGLFLLGYLLKTVGGASILTCLVCIELPFLVVLLLGSLAVSVNTTLGLALACKGFNENSTTNAFVTASGNSCKEYSITKKEIKFFNELLMSETLSWAVTGALLMTFVVYFILTFVYCFGCCSKSDDEGNQPLLDKPKKVERPKREEIKARYKLNGAASSSNNPFL